VQCLNLGNEIAKLANYHVILLVRGGESVSNLTAHLDVLQKDILSFECPCTYENPCGADCEHCLRVNGKPYCIKMLWGSDWKFMLLVSGADAPSSNGEYCHFCLDRRANRRNIDQTSECVICPNRFTHSKKERVMAELWRTPYSLITDELHIRLRTCHVLLQNIEAKVFSSTTKESAMTMIKDSLVACGVTHFSWFDKAGGQVCMIMTLTP
jgi:hypothetical protein